jgi:phage N-6-adenine-methyltransferase
MQRPALAGKPLMRRNKRSAPQKPGMTDVVVALPSAFVVDISRQPERIGDSQTKLRTYIDLAAKMRKWAPQKAAIHEMIRQQRQFVEWWDNNVGIRQSPGRQGVQSNGGRRLISKRDAERHTSVSQQQVSDWRRELADPDRYFAKIERAARRKAGLEAEHHHRAVNTGEIEWYTPSQYIDMVRRVLSTIDLDPASHAKAQETIRATRFYTRTENGLQRDWHGRVFLNPPYARDLIALFMHKLVAEVAAGRTTEAIVLVNAYTDTLWFATIWCATTLVCFTTGRIGFIDQDGQPVESPTTGNAFIYIGPNEQRFITVFAGTGLLAKPIHLRGRDPDDFAIATKVLGLLELIQQKVMQIDLVAAKRGLNDEDKQEVVERIARITDWLNRLKGEFNAAQGA